MIKRMILMLVAVGVVFGGIFGFEAFRSKMIKQFLASMGSQPQTVSTVTAAVEAWQPKREAVGSLRAVNGADLGVEAAGIVESVSFNSGDEVVAGTVLLRLRADDDQAKLQALEATAQLAALVYERDLKQLQAQAIAQATVDADAANLKNAKAQVVQQQATIDKKVVRAPFSGRLGIRAVDLGQFINAGTPVVTLQALDPLYVDFNMPQQALAEVKVGMPVAVRIDGFGDQVFTGKISAIDPKVDTGTRNLQLRATLRNPERKLLPGMYARIEIDTGAAASYVTLPHSAVTFNPYGDTVYLVEDQGKDDKGQPKLVARQSFVGTGPTRGDQVAVLKGVKAGDTVVSAGQIKLHNGTRLLIDNSVQPSNDASPTPNDQ